MTPRNEPRAFERSYAGALNRFLEQGATASLRPALKLGREAVRLGMETLDIALVHEQALVAQALPVSSALSRSRIIARAGMFFAEAILPMEQTHRSAIEANVRLSKLNQILGQRTLALVASNRSLKREIAERRVMEQTLRQSERQSVRVAGQSRRLQEELRQLSRRILSAQEEERKRISRELHDVIAQILTSINVRLAILKTEATANTAGLSRNIARTQELVEKSVGIVHRFAFDLRPAVLDYLGLIPALETFIKGFTKTTGVRVSLTTFAGVEDLGSGKRTALYRVVQEALTNVGRHARASRVDVRIERRPNAIDMSICDDGWGFNVKRGLSISRCKRLGLIGLRERVEMIGGTFTLESVPGQGTTIKARIPFGKGDQEKTRS